MAQDEHGPSERASLWHPIGEAVAALARRDPGLRRFGAATHRYRLAPPVTPEQLARLERAANVRLPDDYRDFVLTLGEHGAGPYYGLWPLDDPRQGAALAGECELGQRAPGAPWRGVVALGHLGCGHVAFLVVTGPQRGQVWLDAATVGVIAPIAPHFVAYYTQWLEALEQGQWPAAHVPPGACALAQGISGYLEVVERRRGLGAGELAGAELRQALEALGPGSIRLETEGSRTAMLPAGTPVAPCLACEQLLEALGEQGLDRAAVAGHANVVEKP